MPINTHATSSMVSSADITPSGGRISQPSPYLKLGSFACVVLISGYAVGGSHIRDNENRTKNVRDNSVCSLRAGPARRSVSEIESTCSFLRNASLLVWWTCCVRGDPAFLWCQPQNLVAIPAVLHQLLVVCVGESRFAPKRRGATGRNTVPCRQRHLHDHGASILTGAVPLTPGPPLVAPISTTSSRTLV